MIVTVSQGTKKKVKRNKKMKLTLQKISPATVNSLDTFVEGRGGHERDGLFHMQIALGVTAEQIGRGDPGRGDLISRARLLVAPLRSHHDSARHPSFDRGVAKAAIGRG